MDRLAKQQTCQLFIEQEIEKGLAEGKSTHSIGREIAEEIKRIFLAIVPPGTIQVRAVRMKKQADTNVSPDPTPQNDNYNPKNQKIKDGRGGVRTGAGRPRSHQICTNVHRKKKPRTKDVQDLRLLKEVWRHSNEIVRQQFLTWIQSRDEFDKYTQEETHGKDENQ